MPGYVSISTRTYSNAFLTKVFKMRSEMSDYEKYGLYQLLYTSAFNNIEAIIASIYRGICLENRLFIVDEKVLALNRILEEFEGDVEKASFSRIESLHFKFLGCTLKEKVGSDLHLIIRALNEIRNIVTHGRDLKVEILQDPESEHCFSVNTDFSTQPMQSTYKVLEKLGIFNPEIAKNMQPSDVNNLIFDENAVMHFWNKGQQIYQIYRNYADSAKILGISVALDANLETKGSNQ